MRDRQHRAGAEFRSQNLLDKRFGFQIQSFFVSKSDHTPEPGAYQKGDGTLKTYWLVASSTKMTLDLFRMAMAVANS